MMKNIFLMMFTLLILGCKPNADRFGITRNQERIKDSLPLLPDKWIYVGFEVGVFTWCHPDKDSLLRNGIAFYGEKKVQLLEGKLFDETDKYFSGHKYIVNKGGPDEIEVYENIQVSRNYEKNLVDSWGKWSAHPQCADASNLVNISLREVETILKKWGIERLNW